jgi:hypothetical protein
VICLSFDTDHLDEVRMREFLGSTPIPGAGTFFCAYPYPGVDYGSHEPAPHPFLGEEGGWEDVLAETRRNFPEAAGCRPHSCVWSHMLSVRLAEQGYAYISCWDQIGRRDIRPHREAWGLWHLPIYYMDTLDISAPRFWPDRELEPFSAEFIDAAVGGEALFVFGFHPVHLMLNSTSAEAYLERRDAFHAGEDPADLRCPGLGVADFYRALCERMEAEGEASRTMRDALAASVEPSPIAAR